VSERTVTAADRALVRTRAHERCEYCRCPERFAVDQFSIEHIVPRARGGSSSVDNLALACQTCNNFKHTKTAAVDPASSEIVPLYNPQLHRWQEHFAWDETFTLIIGLTPIGRATAELLDVNRARVVNLRGVLCVSGDHPPKE
jgi:hypothetical protein